ncbi:hypothetical protein Tco_0027120 [Tanacetum coccineum]
MKAITGPRVVKVDKVPTASPAAQATSARVGNTPDACVWQHKAFQDEHLFDIPFCESTLMGVISTIVSSTWTCFLNAVNLDQQLLLSWGFENDDK